MSHARRADPSGQVIALCDTCDGTKSGKREVDWSGEYYYPCSCPSAPEGGAS